MRVSQLNGPLGQSSIFWDKFRYEYRVESYIVDDLNHPENISRCDSFDDAVNQACSDIGIKAK